MQLISKRKLIAGLGAPTSSEADAIQHIQRTFDIEPHIVSTTADGVKTKAVSSHWAYSHESIAVVCFDDKVVCTANEVVYI